METEHSKICIYCNTKKPVSNFSCEHIWPDALGGNYLSEFWRTSDVCRRCNNISGVFVDGAFLKGFLGMAERSSGAEEYLTKDKIGILPLHFLGILNHGKAQDGEIVEYWAGPCGENLIFIYPDGEDQAWNTYAGGDPRAKKGKKGRVYIALTSSEPYWYYTALKSIRAHFRNADLFILNADLSEELENYFKPVDYNKEPNSRDKEIIDHVINASKEGRMLNNTIAISLDFGNRFLAKLALAVGYKLLGNAFATSTFSENLRSAFWEANAEKRSKLPIKGSGYNNRATLNGVEAHLKWIGGWVIFIKLIKNSLTLNILSPSGKYMCIQVFDDVELASKIDGTYRDGLVWVVVPTVAQAVGPIGFEDYIAHCTLGDIVPDLTKLAALRSKRSELPPKRVATAKN